LSAAAPARQSFAALRHPGFRFFFIGMAVTMLADNIEHVISYWVMFQKFHSEALAGFAVISHWVPFLLFSVYAGALAERFDPRRIIQLGMLLFMGVSLGWGILFATDSLHKWEAATLLIIHGIAGVLWNPPAQLLLHDIVGPEELQSAVRLNATGRYLGIFCGPAVGSVLLLLLGPVHGILLNALIYLPMLLWLWKAPYGPRFRPGEQRQAPAVRGIADILDAFRSIRESPTLLSMTLLAGGAAFFVGNSYQAQMPEFTRDLGHGNPGLSYGMLLAADAAGALTAGFVLEGGRLLKANPSTALVLALVWCGAIGGFALCRSYPLALALLFCAGFVELSFNSMAQALVQINAPAAMRGRVIGVFSMAASGMRTFAGITVGLVGGLIGIHWSLALSAILFLFVVGALFGVGRQPARRAEA
jgi:MFS family permease